MKNCEDCPGRDVCDGEPLVLVMELMVKYADLLVMLTAMGKETGAGVTEATVLGFTMGYMVRTAEAETPQLDMSVWGVCFEGGADDAS